MLNTETVVEMNGFANERHRFFFLLSLETTWTPGNVIVHVAVHPL